MSTITVSLDVARLGDRFEPAAFARQVGKKIRMVDQHGALTYEGTLISVTVSANGTEATLTIEVPGLGPMRDPIDVTEAMRHSHRVRTTFEGDDRG